VIRIVPIDDAEQRSQLCESILRALPRWFGIEHAIIDYVRDVASLPTLGAWLEADEPVGFLALKLHTRWAAEIYVLGVREEAHRRGVGRALVSFAEEQLAAHGVEYLQVKTLGPSRESESYERTRAFYEAVGFRALEELHGLWDEGNPTLIMVKRLIPAEAPRSD
jgi:ribosomal protein S18 acetylase RimI-like enzyme